MNTHFLSKYIIVATLLSGGSALSENAFGQWQPLTLNDAVNHALESNNLLQIRNLQALEAKSKVEEMHIKAYPNVTATSTYLYNANVGKLTIPQGTLGELPLSSTDIIQLPNSDLSYNLGKHNNFSAGILAYQPITQQKKIKTGIEAAKSDVTIAELQKEKAAQEIRQGVEKLYYGILIAQKKQEEAQSKLDADKLKLYDVESALMAGKTITVNKAGLQAEIANQEQELLKQQFQEEDYWAALRQLTGLQAEKYQLTDLSDSLPLLSAMPTYSASADSNNINTMIAKSQLQKGHLGLQAAEQSFIPDVGVVGGYFFQKGSILFPESNPFIGVNLRWDIQNIFTNKQQVAQRKLQIAQAEQNLAYNQKEVQTQIETAYRKAKQAAELIQVAAKAVHYRKEELKVEEDGLQTGLSTRIKVLEAKSELSKSEADLFAAKLGYRLAISDLKRTSDWKN